MKELKGKKVFSVEEHNRYSGGVCRVEITFDDGTVLHISHGPHGIHNSITKGEPPKEKIIPWKQNEIKFIAKLSQEEKEEYEKARSAFFWLVDNRNKFVKHYSYFDKKQEEMRTSFSFSVDKEENDPEGILTIFLSSHIAPECDDWFVLGLKRDWKRILEMKNEVEKSFFDSCLP